MRSREVLCRGLVIAGLLSFPQQLAAAVIGPYYVFGTVTGLTTVTSGLMIQVEGDQIPQNCTNNPSGWLFIDRAYPEITSAVLSHWLAGKRYMYVYTGATSSGYCSVSQVQVSP